MAEPPDDRTTRNDRGAMGAAFHALDPLLATAGATNLLAVTFLIPVTAIALSTVVLGETLARRHVAGFALIALGLTLIDGRAWRWRVASSRPI
jgi:drug/metabolite transporter (DMT)-like permease